MDKTRTLTLNAASVALVAATTLIIRIPVPATQGYIHPGDAVIIAAALLFGRRTGFIAGGVGSAMADLMGGYAHWAPLTLLIKGTEGFLVGAVGSGRWGRIPIRPALASLFGGLAMVAGYFVAESWFYGTEAATIALSANLVQAGFGLAVGFPGALSLRRSGLGSSDDFDGI